jgi:hypothetical protein
MKKALCASGCSALVNYLGLIEVGSQRRREVQTRDVEAGGKLWRCASEVEIEVKLPRRRRRMRLQGFQWLDSSACRLNYGSAGAKISLESVVTYEVSSSSIQ